MNTKGKGIRIYSMARFMTFLAILILIAFLTGGILFKSTVSGMEEQEYQTVTVMTGDTLWEIADEYNGGKDVRNLVEQICHVNEVKAEELYPGQTLKIPVEPNLT